MASALHPGEASHAPEIERVNLGDLCVEIFLASQRHSSDSWEILHQPTRRVTQTAGQEIVMGDKTSESYISPLHYRFCDPKDIEKDCACKDLKFGHFECDEETNCEKAGGRCYVVVQGPGDPQLTLPKHESDTHHKADVDPPPGWQTFCACLKYTGKDPTDDEKKKTWPKPTEWKPPKGYKLPKDAKACGMPVKEHDDWKCPDKDCTLVGVKKEGETQLVKLADPGNNVRPKDIKDYWAIFCVHLDKE